MLRVYECLICQGEDGKTLCGQVLDVNMVSEPKAHLTKSKAVKRQKEAEGGQGVVTYFMPGLGPVQTSVPTAKRPRVEEGDPAESEM